MNSIIQLIIFLYLQLMINMFEKCSHIFDNMSDHFDQELNCSFIIKSGYILFNIILAASPNDKFIGSSWKN